MKVALVCSDKLPCPPIRGGAIQLLINETAPLLQAYKHQITVFSIKDETLSESEIINGIQYIRFNPEQYLNHVLAYMKKYPFHLVQLYNRPQWIPFIKEVSPKSKIFLSLHNLIINHTISVKESKHAVESADRIITVSKFVANEIKRKYKRHSKKIIPIYTGVNVSSYTRHYSKAGERIAKKMKATLGIPDDYQVILYVGRLLSYKGCHYLIESMRTVLAHHPKTALVIVGSRWYSERLETPYIKQLKEAAAIISEKIYFTNYVPLSQIPAYYTMANIFVCPSQWREPLARVGYEAMGAEIPIITSKRGGNPEIINHGKNGYIVKDYKNPDAYAKYIIALLKDTKLQKKMGIRNRKLAKTKYSFKRYSVKLARLWSKSRR